MSRTGGAVAVLAAIVGACSSGSSGPKTYTVVINPNLPTEEMAGDGGTVALSCTSAADCPSGQVCCFGLSMMTACQAGPCPSTAIGRLQLCATAAECLPAEDSCQPADPCVPGLPIKLCTPPGCTSSADCMVGQVCCGQDNPTSTPSCQAGPCPDFGLGPIQLCATPAECFAAGDSCEPPNGCGPALNNNVCTPPTGDGGAAEGAAGDSGTEGRFDGGTEASVPTACAANGGQCIAADGTCWGIPLGFAADQPPPCGTPSAVCCDVVFDAGSSCTDGGGTTVRASSYDQSCMVDTDCVGISAGDSCNPCDFSCVNASINAAALSQYTSDTANLPAVLAVAKGACASSCGGPETACCVGGTCHWGYFMCPAADTDAGDAGASDAPAGG